MDCFYRKTLEVFHEVLSDHGISSRNKHPTISAQCKETPRYVKTKLSRNAWMYFVSVLQPNDDLRSFTCAIFYLATCYTSTHKSFLGHNNAQGRNGID